MKHTLLSLFVICFLSPNTQVTFIGDLSNGFRQSVITNTSNTSDTTQPEMAAAAWTCSSIGFPTCYVRSLFKYDLTSIPVNSVVTDAKLYLYAKNNNINGNLGSPMYGVANSCYIQKVIDYWADAEILNWNTIPAVTTDNSKILQQSSSTSQDYVVDMTDFVQFWVNQPDSNFGAILRLQAENHYNSMVFHSGQAPNDSLKPKLVVTYNTTMPAFITDFRANYNGQSNFLQWTLLNNADIINMEVERSTNKNEFEKIAAIKNTGINSYQYYDVNIANAEKYFYRIRSCLS